MKNFLPKAMPELPEVHTTVTDLQKIISGKKILTVWSSYNSPYHKGKPNIKDLKYFAEFKKKIEGGKILRVRRRAKNILIDLQNGNTILVHMKMTGHLLYGKYREISNSSVPSRHLPQGDNSSNKIPLGWEKEKWIPSEKPDSLLWDPFNRFIRVVFALSNGKSLVLSDVRKFAKVTLFKTDEQDEIPDLKNIGPEPMEKNFTFKVFNAQLNKRPNLTIKQVLMMPEIVAGIGNIYSDELLWECGVHPLSRVKHLPERVRILMHKNIPKVLKEGMKRLGDSLSDYRRPNGERGDYQNHHKAYRNTGKKCTKKDGGTIGKLKVVGRSAHFCSKHQILF